MKPENTPAPPSRGRIWFFRMLLLAISAAVGAAILSGAESYCHKKYANLEEVLAWEGKKGDFFRYDAEVGWLGKPHVAGKHTTGIWISHNELGWRDTPWDLSVKKPKVLLLGDSNMWGYGVKDDEYPGAVLNRIAPQIRWFNAGMNGFGTDQEYLLFKKLKPLVQPDWTVLTFCGNDRDDNASMRVRGYNKPAFVVENGQLVLQNVPVTPPEKGENLWSPIPGQIFGKTHSYLLYHITQIIEARKSRQKTVPAKKAKTIGVKSNEDPTHLIVLELYRAADTHLLVACISGDNHLEAFCKEQNIPYLDLSKTLARQPGQNAYPTGPPMHGHWTPQGNRIAAEEIYKVVKPYLDATASRKDAK
ncbi:MAG: GDSL-type esterase/lipase family protein [Lentisphaerota bacterium]